MKWYDVVNNHVDGWKRINSTSDSNVINRKVERDEQEQGVSLRVEGLLSGYQSTTDSVHPAVWKNDTEFLVASIFLMNIDVHFAQDDGFSYWNTSCKYVSLLIIVMSSYESLLGTMRSERKEMVFDAGFAINMSFAFKIAANKSFFF